MTSFRTAGLVFRPLGFSTRTINALVVQGIFTLGDLGTVTERELLRMPGIGLTAAEQLRIFLRKEGPASEIRTRRRVVSVIFEPESLIAIDAWAGEQGDISSRAEAVRRLVEQALAAQPKAKKVK